MNFTHDQISAIIGAKELEIIALRTEIQRLLAKYEPAPANVQPIREETDGLRP